MSKHPTGATTFDSPHNIAEETTQASIVTLFFAAMFYCLAVLI